MELAKIKQRLEMLWQEVERLEREAPGPGPGGTTDYTELSNKPSINGVELSGNKTSSQLGLITESDITDAFTPSTISIEDGGTFPADARGLLSEHKPIMINDTQYWFLEESGVDYLYGSIPLSGAYPTITYFRVMKESFVVEFHETGFDTVPTDSSNNFITSGGVYTAIQSAGGGTDLTPTYINSTSTFPEDKISVLQKHLPFTTTETYPANDYGPWFYLSDTSNIYTYISFRDKSTYKEMYFKILTINKTTRAMTTNTERKFLEQSETTGRWIFGNNIKELANDTNLNNLATGRYRGLASYTYQNAPETGIDFILTVEGNGQTGSLIRTIQTLIPTSTSAPVQYIRTQNSSTWTSWYKFEGTVVS